MKLASYNDGSRDGQLVVVSRDLSQAHYANGIATRLQEVLDDWGFLAPLFPGGYFPSFNIADAAITAGAVGLITDELLRVRRGR